jgi:hypothetical protein
MTVMQEWVTAQDSPEIPVNENFDTLGYAAVYGYNPATSSGLTWGYYGGRWSGFAVAASTLTLTNTATNYIVVQRSDGVISVSTATTNWNNNTDYARVYRVTTSGGTVSNLYGSDFDYRAGDGGIFGSSAGGGGGGGGGGGSITLGTAAASTSGTVVEFTGIPADAKRVTMMFTGVSTSGTSSPQIQIGTSSGFETSAYRNTNSLVAASGVVSANFTTGFGIGINASNWTGAMVANGSITISLIDSNIWSAHGAFGLSNQVGLFITAGAKTLGGTLDRVRVTTTNGTDTFDAGTVNISWEV